METAFNPRPVLPFEAMHQHCAACRIPARINEVEDFRKVRRNLSQSVRAFME
jgi:hypothetical protein